MCECRSSARWTTTLASSSSKRMGGDMKRWIIPIILAVACTTPDDEPELSSTEQGVQWQQGEISVLVLMAEFQSTYTHETLLGWANEQMVELDSFIRANS